MKATNLLFFLVIAIIGILGRSFSTDDNLREEVESLRNQIQAKYEEGKLEEARELQDLLRDKITRRYTNIDPTEADYDALVEERIRAHRESHRESSKVRYSARGSPSSSRKNSKNNKNNKNNGDNKFSDSRALHQMDQTNRKAEILRNKIHRASGLFTSEEIEKFHQRIQQYIETEEKVAQSLQETSDDYNKARSMRDKESRLKHIEGAKARKQDRHKNEYNLREIARQIFFSLNDELDARLDANKSEL